MKIGDARKSTSMCNFLFSFHQQNCLQVNLPIIVLISIHLAKAFLSGACAYVVFIVGMILFQTEVNQPVHVHKLEFDIYVNQNTNVFHAPYQKSTFFLDLCVDTVFILNAKSHY